MPYRPKIRCKHQGCPELVEYGSYFCDKHKKLHKPKKRFNKPRPSSAKQGYGSRWRKARVTYLHDHPLCVRCQAKGKMTRATVVDHIIPHEGDQRLFWDTNNWQALCKECHDMKTLTEDIPNKKSHR